jgi:hypothetical protein
MTVVRTVNIMETAFLMVCVDVTSQDEGTNNVKKTTEAVLEASKAV